MERNSESNLTRCQECTEQWKEGCDICCYNCFSNSIKGCLIDCKSGCLSIYNDLHINSKDLCTWVGAFGKSICVNCSSMKSWINGIFVILNAINALAWGGMFVFTCNLANIHRISGNYCNEQQLWVLLTSMCGIFGGILLHWMFVFPIYTREYSSSYTNTCIAFIYSCTIIEFAIWGYYIPIECDNPIENIDTLILIYQCFVYSCVGTFIITNIFIGIFYKKLK